MAVVSNQSQVIEAFSKHLQELVKDSSFQYVNNLVNDKVHLEQVNTKLESARDGFIDAIAKLRRQVGEAEKEAKDSKSELKTCQKEAQLQSEEVKKASIEIAALKKHQEQDATVVSEAQESVNKKQDTITQLEQQLTQKSEDYEKAHTAQKDLHVHYNVLRQRYDAAKSSLDGYAALTSGVTEMTRESM